MTDAGKEEEKKPNPKSSIANLDWMYEKPKVDLEEYMTGKRIDKQLIKHVFGESVDEDRAAAVVGAKLDHQPTITPTYDQLAKLKEDPLVAIKKAESQKAKQLVDNPVLMKKFRTLLAEMAAKEESSKKHKKHKKKKSRKRSSSSENSDDVWVEKKSSDHSSKKRKESHRVRDASRSPEKARRRSRDRSEERSHRRRDEPSTSSATANRRPPSSSNKRPHSSAYRPPKLSAEELEAKRRQMMADAESHERERDRHLKRHRETLRKEEEAFHNSTYKEDPSRFSRGLALGEDVGERIRSKLNNVQRTESSADNFLSRR